MMKCVSQPLGVCCAWFILVKSVTKVNPNKPKAGMKIRIPAPADRFALKGLKSLNPS